MPTALALPERQWWPISKSSSSSKAGKDLIPSFPAETLPAQNNSRKSSSGMKFSTITSAMGFKSRRHQPITIPEPPSGHDASDGIDKQAIRLVNRPPAKSVSSTVQSLDDPVEPQTPTDSTKGGIRSRGSMLATPESDPFFSEGIRFQPTIHDPNRLSVYSSSFLSEMGSRKNDFTALNRVSYTSTSSHSLHQPDMSPSSSAASLPARIDPKPTSPTKPTNSRRKRPRLLSPTDVTSSVENAVDLGDLDDDAPSPYPSLSKFGSSSTLTERNIQNELDLDQTAHKPLRGRGMTDGGSTWSPQSIPDFLRSTPSTPKVPSLPTSPVWLNPSTHSCVLARQTSGSRVGPPSAPPPRNLPAPPSKGLPYWSGLADEILIFPPMSSPSGVSFSPAFSSNRDLPLPQPATRNTERELDRESINSKPLAGHTVKKAISHQSFSKRSSNFPSTPRPSTPADDVGDRAPRKQRSFHHNSRSILPPVPTSLRNPPHTPPQPQPQPALPSSSSETQPVVEQRRGSATSFSGRKRLFSGGSVKRPSSQILSPGVADDDLEPVFISEPDTQEGGMAFIDPFGRSDSPAGSVGNEDPPGSPLTSVEYTPQRIMSPAEMLRIEASWNDGSEDCDFGVPRQRVHSFASISTSMSHGARGLASPIPKHYVVDRGSILTGGGSHGQRETGISSPLRRTLQTSTSHASMSQNGSNSPTHSSFHPPAGLSPPPRPRRQTGNSEHQALIVPLSPRPIRRQNSKASTRSQPARSVMRKSSFLEIEDETQLRRSIPVPSKFAGSFLDLERGKDSFDTIRSDDEQES